MPTDVGGFYGSHVTTAAKPKPPTKFDLAKFGTMVEPFSVRVEKVKGTMKYEVTPPPPTEEGWMKDHVRELENWIVTSWSGGGHYFFSITDSSTPAQSMEWVAFYTPHEFPERTPPSLAAASTLSGMMPPSNQPQPKATPVATPLSQLYNFPPSPYAQPYAQPQAPQGPSFFPPHVPFGYPQPMYQQPAAAQPNETQLLREQLARAREEAAQKEFEKRLETIKAESDRKFVELQQSMQAMVEKMTAAMTQQRPTIDPAIEQLKIANQQMAEQLRRQQEEADRARREAELRDQIRAAQEASAKLVEESNRRFEAFMAANANKGPDSQFMMFQAMMTQQMDTMKEMARQSQSQLDRVQQHIMRPQDILAIAKDSAQSTDQVASTMNRQWEAMFNVQRQVIEQVAQLNQGQGGNEVIGLVRDGASALAEMAKKYTGDRAKVEVAGMNAQAEVARAQADVQKAQLERMAQMAAAEAEAKHAAASAAAGLAGVAMPMPNGTYRAPGAAQPQIGGAVNGKPWIPPKQPRVNGDAPANGSGSAPIAAAVPPAPSNVVPIKQPSAVDDTRRKGKTDLEWFGPILPKVHELRSEIEKFLDGLEKNPPVREGADPADVATSIQVAASEIMQRGIPIPAMVELLLQGMVADFLDVLIPNAPQSYRDDVAKILFEGAEETPDDTDDDEDDDDASSDASATVS